MDFDAFHRGEPHGRNFGPLFRTRRLDHGESFFAGQQNKVQRFCGEFCGGHCEIVTRAALHGALELI